MKGGLMGERRQTQLKGRTVTVKVVAIEQNLGKNRGKWVCINEETGRRLHRTERQLRALPVALEQADIDRLAAGTGFTPPQLP